jgi:hypothetical protein
MLLYQCVLCRHFRPGSLPGLASCPSFPGGGIPGEIGANVYDHRQPHWGEHPLPGTEPTRFEPRDDIDRAQLEALSRALDSLHASPVEPPLAEGIEEGDGILIDALAGPARPTRPHARRRRLIDRVKALPVALIRSLCPRRPAKTGA